MRDVVVTGVGLISAAGEGVAAHLDVVAGRAEAQIDCETFAPFSVHPVVPPNYDVQIAKKSDQRQMEPWQRLGTYAAGLALDAAQAKHDAALKADMHLIVAAGGGERDYAVDGQILTGLRRAAEPGVFLNERLMADLRPTLFLAQLSNLLAGNIAIVHGVTGASRTFMGEEASGVDALRVAQARIASGQNEIFLVGGAYNAQRPDVLLIYEMGGFLWKGARRPVFERRKDGGGIVLGTGACFLMLESRRHAEGRGVPPLAVLDAVASDRSRREPGSVRAAVEALARKVGGAPDLVLSGATGAAGITEEEREAIAAVAGSARLVASSDVVGHTMEAQAPFGVALAAASIAAGEAREALVTSVGHRRGEGTIRLGQA